MPGDAVGLDQIAGSALLIAVAVALSRWQRVEVERQVVWAAARAFVQLTALGYAIKLIFEADSGLWVAALLAAMILFGAFTARGRAAGVPRALPIMVGTLAASTAATLGLALSLGVMEATPRTIVPLGGMMIGNAMVGAAVALERLGSTIRDSAAEIEARLSLGASAAQAARPVVRRSLASGMIGVVDSTKTAGLVFIPGTMLGMLLAGADPVDAVRLQLILFYLLLGNVAIAVVLAVVLAARGFFTAAHQLREPA